MIHPLGGVADSGLASNGSQCSRGELILSCAECRRPLGAADVVGSTRLCVGCSGPVPAQVSMGERENWVQRLWHRGIRVR